MSSSTAFAPRTRNMMSTVPMYVLMLLATLVNFVTQAAPVDSTLKLPGADDNDRDGLSKGPYNLTVQGGIAGAILIIAGFILCFFGVRFFRVCMFLIGFYFFGNITYIGMANGGVTSGTLLLVISLIVGIFGGLLLVCCSRLGIAILGALAMYALGLWILGWKSGGVINSSSGRGVFLAVLVIIGFIIGFVRKHETVIVGSAIVGAYSFVVGAYALLATFIVMAILGMVIQFRMWGRRAFGTVPAGNVVYTEKPSRFG
ncbi:hypothetical protein BG011_008116, partial [Mortierella polycephala]